MSDEGLTGPHRFSVFREVSRVMQPVRMAFARSGPAAVQVVESELHPASRVMLRQVSDPGRPVHVVGWWWDLAGGGPTVVPAEADAKDWSLALGPDGVRRLAEPLPLYGPDREIVAGLAVRMILWQGEPGTDPARVTAEVTEAMRHTSLGGVLGMLATSVETTMATVIAVRQAAAALGPEIAPVLRALCPDYLDFFEGFFPATEFTTTVDSVEGYASTVTIRTTTR